MGMCELFGAQNTPRPARFTAYIVRIQKNMELPVTDIGLTHVALPCTDMERTITFYRDYGDMEIVHDRDSGGARVVWLSDKTRPFVIVFLETQDIPHPLGPFSHLGVGLASREEVDARIARARAAGVEIDGPHDTGPPVGYWAFLRDPDGHTLELAYGQAVHLVVDQASLHVHQYAHINHRHDR